MKPLKILLELVDLIQVDPGEIIIKQGEQTEEVYFLLKGRIGVEILNEYDEKIELNEISRGEFFGEMSLLTNEPRAATLIRRPKGREKISWFYVQCGAVI